MAADVTSTYFDAKVSIFKLTTVDISANITNVDFHNTFKTNDVTTYGKIGTVPALSLDDSSIDLDLVWQQLSTSGTQTVVGAAYYAKTAVAFEYYPAGTTSGNTKLYGNVMVQTYEFAGKVGDSVRIKSKLLVNNGVTNGTAT